MTTIAPKCGHCGNDGAESALYLTIDARYIPGKGWTLEERTDDGGMELDCLACDKRTPVDGGDDAPDSGFPYDAMPAAYVALPFALEALAEVREAIAWVEDDDAIDGAKARIDAILADEPMVIIPAGVKLEFWLGTATDQDGDLHNSETVWGDGMTAAEALELYQGMLRPYPEGYLPEGCDIVVHGPYSTNDAAKG